MLAISQHTHVHIYAIHSYFVQIYAIHSYFGLFEQSSLVLYKVFISFVKSTCKGRGLLPHVFLYSRGVIP